MNKKTNKRLSHPAFMAGLLGVAVSVSLGVGTSFALFNDAVGSSSTISVGDFDAVATVTVGAETRSAGQTLSRQAQCVPAGCYELTVSGKGSTTGYAVIKLDAQQSDIASDSFSTGLLTNKTGYTYKLELNEDTAISVIPIWDSEGPAQPKKTDNPIIYGELIETQTADEKPTDTVKTENTTEPIKAEIKTDTIKTELKTDTIKTELKTDPVKTEVKTDPIKTELKTNAVKTELKTDAVKTELKTDPIKTELKTDTVKTELKTDAVQTQSKSDTVKTETKTESTTDTIQSDRTGSSGNAGSAVSTGDTGGGSAPE